MFIAIIKLILMIHNMNLMHIRSGIFRYTMGIEEFSGIDAKRFSKCKK